MQLDDISMGDFDGEEGEGILSVRDLDFEVKYASHTTQLDAGTVQTDYILVTAKTRDGIYQGHSAFMYGETADGNINVTFFEGHHNSIFETHGDNVIRATINQAIAEFQRLASRRGVPIVHQELISLERAILSTQETEDKGKIKELPPPFYNRGWELLPQTLREAGYELVIGQNGATYLQRRFQP